MPHYQVIRKVFVCEECGSGERPHHGQGLCKNCYQRLRYQKVRKEEQKKEASK